LGTRLEVTKTVSGGTVATIKVTMISYRESRFLTKFASGGLEPPAHAYYIMAKGLKGLFDPVLLSQPKLTEGAYGTKRHLAKIGRRMTSSRLKVPRAGLEAVPGRFGRMGRRAFVPGGIPLQPDEPQSILFYYPLWVLHPGFGEQGDVVEKVINEEAALWKQENIGNAVVSFDPVRAKKGISLTSGGILQVTGAGGRAPSSAYTGGIADPVRLAKDAGARQARQSMARLTGTPERPALPRFRDYPIE